MLTRKEDVVMKAVFSLCGEKNALLISPHDLIKNIADYKIGERELDKVMNDLATDRYFDLVYSDCHGEMVYCITLTNKGKGYERDKKVFKRNLIARLFLTAIFATISFIIGIILKAVF